MADKDPYVYKIRSVHKVVDGDTIDADIDLGFNISLTKRIRLADVDTPECRTSNTYEKKLGLEVKQWLQKNLDGKKEILIKTELPDSTEKYGRILGRLYVDGVCLNDRMIEEGYAWKYDGGTKKKDFALLEAKRNAISSLT
ncbi:thermonuclease family protein [Anabaenopsis elenkinii]|uniref:Thermonuclease family protein n=1 Tax=Anabaenopsis elenkinii CCIBt3563 TaxID=2779889 RepID=A0A7S6U5I4_9CYAN|nr:thermonuclease family protein [Anabaenopsis elenkinii]QOV22805.1 thermonuclease family protein [Anabaenopsis elenkinii CCIBt3563]QOV24496.1 thermonuclease family protein [Anabaenopsis elenkinii CCIBt3563]